MNQGNSAEPTGQDRSSGRPLKFGGKTIGGIGAVVLIAVYSFAQPILKERFGVNLPSLRQNAQGQVVAGSDAAADQVSAEKSDEPQAQSQKSTKQTDTSKPESKKESTPSTSAKQPDEKKTKPGPLADRIRSQPGASGQATRGSPQTKDGDDSELLYGILREVRPKHYLSPAGLQYKPGSAEGHRLEHLRRHVKDDTRRPFHGVFDGDMAGALKTIDQAFEKAKKGVRTSKKVDDGRTIYTVDMGKRVGFLGGRDGQRKRNPMARRVRIVLEGTSVITAYPVN